MDKVDKIIGLICLNNNGILNVPTFFMAFLIMSPNNDQTVLLQQRYGLQKKPQNIHWTPQVKAMLSHRSVRTFLSKALPEGALETMMAAAQSASTSSALNQWSLVAVTNSELKQKISNTVALTVPTDRIPWIEEAPVLLLWIADLSRSEKITKEQGGNPIVLDYLDSFLMASIDTSLAAQNASLAAESMGLGVVFLGVMRNAAKEIAKIVNLPSYSFVTFGMAVGYPDPSRLSGIRPRPAQPMILHYNHYQSDEFTNYLEKYEESLLNFRVKQGMEIKTWKEAVYSATTSIKYMGGREKLRQTVTQKGFKLL